MRAINIKPNRGWHVLLACIPFVLLVVAYSIGSDMRLAANPNDKLLPGFGALSEALKQYAFTADARTGLYLMWSDTIASLTRLLTALAISTMIALVFGILVGLLPIARSGLGPFVAVASMVPPLALLPILFIVMGLGEASKIALIVIGTTLKLTRDLALRVEEIPREQIIKAQTLGASTWQIATRVITPQMLPRLLDALRLEIGPAWLFLIAAEAIAADSRSWLPHLPRSPLSVDGRHHPLRHLDHAARIHHGFRVALVAGPRVSLVCRSARIMNAIVFDKVWKEYGDHVVLEQINLDIAPRSFVALVGPSGCGKTTFLRMLLGEEIATRGSILVDGKTLKAEPDSDRGVVFQRYSVFPHLTVAAERHDRPRIRTVAPARPPVRRQTPGRS